MTADRSYYMPLDLATVSTRWRQYAFLLLVVVGCTCVIIYHMWFFEVEMTTPMPYHKLQHFSANVSLALQPMKTLLFMTTSMSQQHIRFLRYCWPIIVARSALLQSCDVLVFATSDEYSRDTSSFQALVQELMGAASYPASRVHSMVVPNPGYQEGAILAMHEAMRHGWFSDGHYDWIIRLNPDVLVLDDEWIVNAMTDDNVDAILSTIYDGPNIDEAMSGINTDFIVFRPHVLSPGAYNSSITKNAEQETMKEFKGVLDSLRYSVLVGKSPPGSWRVGGMNCPVVHDHNMVQECRAKILS